MNVLSVQSTVVYGHVGNSAATFPLQRLGHEVWPVATVAFSNHPAHGGFRGRIVPAAEVRDLLDGLAERGLLARCDAVLSGYLGDPATGGMVLETVARVREARPGALYCCDPVIGEVGRGVYVRTGIPDVFRDRLVPAADIVTPNPFELEYLTGTAPATLPAALAAARTLLDQGPGLVVATGLRLGEDPERLAVLAAARAEVWVVRHPFRIVPAWGTGDAFTALFLGAFLGRRNVRAALEHAAAALDAVLVTTAAAGADELCLVAAQDALVTPPVRYPAERLA